MTTGIDTPPDQAQATFADVRHWIGALGSAVAGRPGDAYDRDGRNIGNDPRALSASIADALTNDAIDQNVVDNEIMNNRDLATRLWEAINLAGAGLREALRSVPDNGKRRRDGLARGFAVETLIDFSAVADHYNAQALDLTQRAPEAIGLDRGRTLI